MPTFTLELWRVMAEYGSHGEDLDAAAIGLDTYPIFDAAYREPLNEKIYNHFYNCEIGLETVELYRFNMRRKMAEIMPLYNKLLKSELIAFDPLSTIDLSQTNAATRAQTMNVNGTSNSAGSNNAKSRSVNSEFPQTALSGSEDYATSAVDSASTAGSTGTNTENSTQQVNGNDSTTATTKGYSGSAADLLTAYRSTLLNIDMLIISELDELHMQVWDNGDSYFGRGF